MSKDPLTLAYLSAKVSDLERRKLPKSLKLYIRKNKSCSNWENAIINCNIDCFLDIHRKNKISKNDEKILCNWIAEMGCLPILKIAVELGYPIYSETMANAISKGDIKMVKYLHSVNCPAERHDITTAFMDAVENEFFDIVTFLIKNRYPIDKQYLTLEALDVYNKKS